MTRPAPFDWTNLAALAVVLAMLAFVLTGCDQPPKQGEPIDLPVTLTPGIGEALGDVDAIPPLATDIRDDAKALTPDNVPTLAPRIERNADEVIDHARAASAKLSETQAVSLKNDRLVAELQGVVAKLQADNAKLREAVGRERASGIRKVQTIVGGVSAVVILAGIGLAVAGNVKLGGIIAAAGAVGAGIAVYFATIAAVAGLVSLVGLIGGLAYLAHRLGWFDSTLRRVVQAVEVTGKQAFATVKDVKANIALTTDDGFHAIVRDETRPAGK